MVINFGIEQEITNWETPYNTKAIKNMTVEHIMPQTINEQSEWEIQMLKNNDNDYDKAMEWHKKNLHTLPNLTLVNSTLNSRLSNGSFKVKKELYKNQTALKISQIIDDYQEWNEPEIKSIASWLVDKIWDLSNKE